MNPNQPRQRAASVGIGFENQLLLDAAILLLPALGVILFLWLSEDPQQMLWLVAPFAGVLTLVQWLRLRQHAIYPLYTLSNLLEALREGDFSLRGSRARRGDAIGDVVFEVNALSQTLREQRLQVEETSALLAKIIGAIDIALLSFDEQQRLRLLNPAAERLLGANAAEVLGRSASELGLSEALQADGPQMLLQTFQGLSGRFELRRFHVRERGRPLTLLVITDLSRALREEERQAWQRLIRVLGHELNNSLAPIKSMAQTLSAILDQDPLDADWREDLRGGMNVIGTRAEALNRFMIAYASLARLPPPRHRETALRELLQNLARLTQPCPVHVDCETSTILWVDADQIEQALINLLKNAAEASLPEGGSVHIEQQTDADGVCLRILDEGLGLARSDNLFVPFFTTKPGGSGVGLVLARQIIEAHGGDLTLCNRRDRQGCVATVRLPASVLRAAPASSATS